MRYIYIYIYILILNIKFNVLSGFSNISHGIKYVPKERRDINMARKKCGGLIIKAVRKMIMYIKYVYKVKTETSEERDERTVIQQRKD